MTEAAPVRRRRWPRLLGVLAVVLLVAGIVIDRQMEPTRLAKTVLDQVGEDLGLEITFEGEPEYGLRPEPHLELPDVTIRQPGASSPLLTAGHAEVSLPWDTITGGDSLVITRVQLDSPVLDLAALSAWQATRPETPFELPTLTKGLEVNAGTLVGDGWTVSGLELALPELKAGEPVRADVGGRFELGTTSIAFEGEVALAKAGLVSPLEIDMAGTLSSGSVKDAPWTLVLAGALDAQAEPMRLSAATLRAGGSIDAGGENVPWTLQSELDATIGEAATVLTLTDSIFDSTSPLPDLDFAGHVELADTLKLGLGGAIPRWPEGWPALPEPLAESRPMAFALAYDGPSDLGGDMRLRLTRDETRFDSRLVLPEVLAWMDREDASPLPPLDGTLDTPMLVVSGFTLEGVHVEFDDDGAAADGPFANVDSVVESTEGGDEATP